MSADATIVTETPPPRRARVLSAQARATQEAGEAARRSASAIAAQARAEGFAAGREAAAAEAAERLAALGLEAARRRAAIELELIDVVMRAVGRVLGEIDDLALVRRVTRAALAEIRGLRRLALHVAPALVERVRAEAATIAAAYPTLESIDVVADATVSPGGAVLRTPLGAVDARLETQLAALRRAFDAALGAEPEAPLEPSEAASRG